MDLIYQLLLIPIFLLFFLKPIAKYIRHHRLQTGILPPGPRNLPLVGCIHHLLRWKPPHHTLRDLSTIHGPIMFLRLGEIPTVVISSPEAAREIMKTHDLTFASRPLTTSIKIICYEGKDIIFSPYGDYWRQMRRLCTLMLLSPKRVLFFRAIRADEVSLFIQSIVESSGHVIDLSSMLAILSNNITTRALIGSRSENQKVFLSALRDVIKLVLNFSIVDLFPSMMPKFLNPLATFHINQCWLKFDRILQKILEDHIIKKDTTQAEIEEDLTDVLLRIQEDADILQSPLSNDHIKAVINDLLVAGSETSTTVMEWVMSDLILNPMVMEKAQKEVREVLKESTTNVIVEELVSGKLSYLSCVIKETMRLHPPAPLLLPRENQEHCKVMGYDIPKKTTVMVNIWAIGRDPKHWDDPEAFRPERFKDNCFDLKGTRFEYTPFGAGRRICPGIQFGFATVELTLAYLLYHFDWKYIPKKGEELDMTEVFGVTMRRKSPLRLLATPHFPLPAI